MEIKRAKIIGNGLSRNLVNDSFYANIPVFACNAAYRTLKKIDTLVALDPVIITEIEQSGFPKEKLFIPDFEDQFEPAEFNPNRPRENSGMVAMRLAIKKGFNELICLGFDFLIEDSKMNLENVYAGSNGYDGVTQASLQDVLNRVKYFEWFANKNPNINFVFIYPNSQKQMVFRKVNAENVYGELM